MVNSEESKSNHSHKTGRAIYYLEMVKNQCSREDSLDIARKNTAAETLTTNHGMLQAMVISVTAATHGKIIVD